MHSATDLNRISLYYHGPAVRTHILLFTVAVERQMCNIHFPEKQADFLSFCLLNTSFKWERFSPFFFVFEASFLYEHKLFCCSRFVGHTESYGFQRYRGFQCTLFYESLFTAVICVMGFQSNYVCGNSLFIANVSFRWHF